MAPDLRTADKLRASGGAIHLLQVRSGDPDLLTVRAARLIRMADVIVHEAAVERAILQLARRDAIKVQARCPSGAGLPDVVPCVLESYARSHRMTVYLKAGD